MKGATSGTLRPKLRGTKEKNLFLNFLFFLTFAVRQVGSNVRNERYEAYAVMLVILVILVMLLSYWPQGLRETYPFRLDRHTTLNF